MASEEGLHREAAQLYVDAIDIWFTKRIDEAPTKEWLAEYLPGHTHTSSPEVYQAWDADDCVWSVYAWFWGSKQRDSKRPDESDAEHKRRTTEEAADDLWITAFGKII